MKTYRAIVAILLVAFMQSVLAQPQVARHLGDGVALIEASSSVTKVAVVVNVRAAKTADLMGDLAAPGQFPETVLVIQSLRIDVNGSPIFVPRSAYADLLAVREAEVLVTDRVGILRLRGGDASESYLARIEFDKAMVKRRAIFNPALSERKPLQETTYYLRTMEDR